MKRIIRASSDSFDMHALSNAVDTARRNYSANPDSANADRLIELLETYSDLCNMERCEAIQNEALLKTSVRKSLRAITDYLIGGEYKNETDIETLRVMMGQVVRVLLRYELLNR